MKAGNEQVNFLKPNRYRAWFGRYFYLELCIHRCAGSHCKDCNDLFFSNLFILQPGIEIMIVKTVTSFFFVFNFTDRIIQA